MKFSIETVSKMTGIASASLRNWEKRYGFPQPERTSGGHRFYSAHDIDFLKKAACMIHEGHPLADIAKLYLQSLGISLSRPIHEPAPVKEIKDDVAYRVELLYEALIRFDQNGIQTHYSLLNAKLSPEQLFDRVFECLLRRMRMEWSQGLITIAQEHYAASFLRLKLASFLAIEFPPTYPDLILAATLSDEKHEAALLLVSAHLKFRGYAVSYFGVDLPIADLRGLVEQIKPRVLALSYWEICRLKEDLPHLQSLGIPVIIGGMALVESECIADIKSLVKDNIHFCEKSIGREAARFVELICCQSKS